MREERRKEGRGSTGEEEKVKTRDRRCDDEVLEKEEKHNEGAARVNEAA